MRADLIQMGLHVGSMGDGWGEERKVIPCGHLTHQEGKTSFFLGTWLTYTLSEPLTVPAG